MKGGGGRVRESTGNEVGKKLGIYGDDSDEPVKLFFFTISFFSFFVAGRCRKLH